MPLPYYRLNAQAYANATREVNMSALHAKFLSQVPSKGSILDAGCGSGRDSLAFVEKGFEVDAFDGCEELAHLASKHAGLDVKVQSFQEFTADKQYDAIWACASLLHVPEQEQSQVWQRLWSALKPGGVAYASYKLGLSFRTDDNGRPFTDANERRLPRWLAGLEDVADIQTWITTDQRANMTQYWFNALVHRKRA